jgi:hypothetical protein
VAFPETVVNQGYPPEKWRNPSDAEVFDGDVNEIDLSHQLRETGNSNQ